MKALTQVAKTGSKAAAAVKDRKAIIESQKSVGVAPPQSKNKIQTIATIGSIASVSGFLAFKMSKSPVIALVTVFVTGTGAFFLDSMLQNKIGKSTLIK